MSDRDAIGVVREHRWIAAEDQAKRLLEDGCRIVVSLDGGKKLKHVDRPDLERLVRPGTVLKFVYAFLLAEPKRYVAPTRADLGYWMKRLLDGRGGVLKDVDTGLTTETPGHRKAIVAVADNMITRSCQGAKSAHNGIRRRGRPLVSFTAEQIKDAKAVWRNVKDYSEWADARRALPKGFTVHRAYKLWGSRK